ncbi:hypothetical protein MPSEU_000314900 [Mayamaea pseudoterrestris]|nr:hypothetical protein MPSEU_000314900 [Mayamaea pseudoterrestris]
MSRTSFASDDAVKSSDAILRFEELQRASPTTTVSWDEDVDDDDDDDGLETSCTNEEQPMALSLPYIDIWEALSSSVLVSFITAGCVWHAELLRLLSLPLQFIIDLPQYFNAWPPALTLLASLTVVAIVLQPEGYTWIIFRRAGDCVVIAIRESSTVWSILVNNFGTILSTIMATSVFIGLFGFAYVLHRALSPRPKLHLQYHDATEHKHGKRRRKKSHGPKVNNRLRPCSNKHAAARQENVQTFEYMPIDCRDAPPLPFQSQPLAKTVANVLLINERKLSNNDEVLPTLSDESARISPLSVDLSNEPQISSSPKELPAETHARATSTSQSAWHSSNFPTLNDAATTTTTYQPSSCVSDRFQAPTKAVDIPPPPGFSRAAICSTPPKSTADQSLSARNNFKVAPTALDLGRTTAHRSNQARRAVTPHRMLERKQARKTSHATTAIPTKSRVWQERNTVSTPPGLPVAPTPPNDNKQILSFASEYPPVSSYLEANQVRMALSSPVPSISPLRVNAENTLWKSPSQENEINAISSPFATPVSCDLGFYTSTAAEGTSYLNIHTSDSPSVWNSSILTPSPQRYSDFPPPPGISCEIPTQQRDGNGVGTPSLGPSSLESSNTGNTFALLPPPSRSYGGLGTASSREFAPQPRSYNTMCLDSTHKTVPDNPFLKEEHDSDEELEAELQELGGRMVGSLLDNF